MRLAGGLFAITRELSHRPVPIEVNDAKLTHLYLCSLVLGLPIRGGKKLADGMMGQEKLSLAKLHSHRT